MRTRRARALDRKARAAAVTGTAIVVGLIAATALNPSAGIALGTFAALLLTLVTIPQDLHPGEFDVFGLVIAGLFVLAGIVGLATERHPHIVYGKYDDPG